MRTAIVLFLAASSAVHSAEDARARGKRVVNEAVAALGGKAFLAMEDRVEAGRAYSFFRQELQGLDRATIYTRYVTPQAGKPGVRERQNFSKDQSFGYLFNEDGGWELTYRGAQMVEPKRLENWKDSTLRNVFYILRQRLNEPGMEFYSQGTDRYENLPAEIVDITDATGTTVTVTFSASTKLPVRQVFKRRNPEYKDFDTEETVFAKYRDVGGGAMWPYSIRRFRNGEKIFEMYSDNVQINKNLTDDLFTIPAKLKILPPAK